MPHLVSPKQALEHHGLRPKRHFGQNFLQDSHLAERIAELATETPGGTVVEIGAGLGALTAPLLERAAQVIAIERDRDLVPCLLADFADAIESGKLRVEEADAKTVPYATLLAAGPAPRVIAGNLPYQITGPLLEKLVEVAGSLVRAVILVQLEVADRLSAAPDSDHYGALTVFIQARYSVKRAFIIRRGAFYPAPAVDSAVVVLDPLEVPISEETTMFRALVHGGFGQRRKKLRNAWRQLPGVDEARLSACAEKAGIDLDARGETLSVHDYARMTRELGG